MKKITFIFSLGLTLIFSSQNAFAVGSGAYRIETVDAEALGKGNSFVAQADNPSAVYFNPAGLTQLKGKLNVSLGAAALQPFCTYKDASGNKTDRRRQVFTIPNAFIVSNFGLEKFSFGIGGTSYWGLGTWWAEDSFSKYVSTKADYLTEDVMFTAAYKLNDNLSIGASADYVRSYANKKKKLLQGGIGDDGEFQLKARDNSAWGYRLSSLYKLNAQHSFGFMYRSPVEVKYKGKIYLDDLNNNGSTLYNLIFGGNSYAVDITSKSKLPQSMVLGYCYKPNDKWRFEFDMEWMDWSSVEEEKIDYPSGFGAEAIPGARSAILNAGNPDPKDWRAGLSYGFGAEYKVNAILKLRAGYFFHKTPVPQSTFHTSLPDASSNTVTIGTGINLNKNTTLDFAYAGVFYLNRKITNNVGSTSGADIDGQYKSFINAYVLTLTFKI